MADSDEALVRRIATGDRQAYGELVGRHLARIVSFAGRLLGDRASAEDVAQETFLKVWLHAAGWRDQQAKFTTWLHTVALNLCRDRLSKKRESPLDGVPEPGDGNVSLLEQVQRRIVGDRIQTEMRTLPEAQCAAIVLCHHQGLHNREAAEVLGISVDALESLLARGRRTLRERLANEADELFGPGEIRHVGHQRVASRRVRSL